MEFTNRYNLQSKSLLDALTNDDYDLVDAPSNIVSVTRLIDSPCIEILTKRHSVEITEDVSGRVWQLLGKAIHHVMEMSNLLDKTKRLTEARWFLLVPVAPVVEWKVFTCPEDQRPDEQEWYNKEDFYVSGKLDTYEFGDGILEDYKVTSAYAFILGGKESWDSQLNMNAMALRMLGHETRGLRIVGIIKDHDQHKADADPNYPQIPLIEHYCNIWDDKKVQDYILDRVMALLNQRQLDDSDLMHCSKEERWYRGGKYAVMKQGNQKAVRGGLFDEDAAGKAGADRMAQELTHSTGKPHFVENRPGIDVRCTDKRQFCSVTRWCGYYQKLYGHAGVIRKGEW